MRRFLSSLSEWQPTVHPVLSVLGPTGSGKTQLVLSEVRRRFIDLRHPLLVSVDAVAFYRGLDIGSAKPGGTDRHPYHWTGLDWLDPREPASTQSFLNTVAPSVAEALDSHRPVILVGGSHFYERALVQGTSPGQASDKAFQSKMSNVSPQNIYEQLLALDSRWRDKVHPNDRYRLTRYADLAVRQKISFDELFGPVHRSPYLQGKWDETATLIVGDIGLTSSAGPSATAVQALARRIESMFAQGWVDEVEGLLRSGVPPNAPSLQSVGYREIVEHLVGRDASSTQFLRERILNAHMQLAKKQRTWLRGMLASNRGNAS